MPLRLGKSNLRQALFFLVRGAFLRYDTNSASLPIGGSRLSDSDLRTRAEKLVKSGYGTYLLETLERGR